MTDTIKFYEVSTETIERRVHKRLIAARSPEDALKEYNRGTAWPSDYDAHTAEVIVQADTVVQDAAPERVRGLGDPNDPENTMARVYFTDELNEEIPWPETTFDDPEIDGGDDPGSV